MATTFKTLTNNDIASSRTLLHEAIPITGTIISGTYGAGLALGSEPNIKNYPHEMFQSIYDYPYLSSSANHIIDISVGYATSSNYNNESDTYHNKKINMYNQMAQILVGYDTTGSILLFDEDGDLTGGSKIREAAFINFSRLLVKDEIKKGSFSLSYGTGSTWANPFADGALSITDASGANGFKVNSPAGEYGILYEGTGLTAVGLVFYQAGVAVLNLTSSHSSSFAGGDGSAVNPLAWTAGGDNVYDVLTGSFSQETFADGLRHRIQNISFNNTVELNSTVYFCRANHNEFNYSSNPTYVSGSKIRVKTNVTDIPVTYATSVGLYSADNELLAVAKLSEPLKKDPTNEITLRVRLDY